MEKDSISELLQRYLSAHKQGKEPYFDADEIDNLLNSFEEKEDYTYYEEILALGMKLHPTSTELKIRKSKYYIYTGKYSKALDLLDRIAEGSNNPDMDLLRLECYCCKDQYPKVLEFIEELISEECDYIESVFEYLAPILSDLEMNTEARDLIDRGLIMFPHNDVLKDELCYLLEMEGDFKEAIRICNELIDRNPYSNDCWFTLGRLHSMIGDFEKAIEAFDFALLCDDSDVELKILKAYCLFMNESYEKAAEAYSEIATDEDSKERIKPLMAECYIKLENFEEAYHLLKDMVYSEDIEKDATLYVNYIRCCIDTDREREAVKILFEAVELFPDNVRILSLLALTYIENGKEDLALTTTNKIFTQLDKINKTADEDCRNLFRKSQYVYFKGDLKKALRFYKKILNIQPNVPFLHLHKAMAYFSLGDMELFGKHYNKATRSELLDYLKLTGMSMQDLHNRKIPRHIPPDELTREFLQNKDNNN